MQIKSSQMLIALFRLVVIDVLNDYCFVNSFLLPFTRTTVALTDPNSLGKMTELAEWAEKITQGKHEKTGIDSLLNLRIDKNGHNLQRLQFEPLTSTEQQQSNKFFYDSNNEYNNKHGNHRFSLPLTFKAAKKGFQSPYSLHLFENDVVSAGPSRYFPFGLQRHYVMMGQPSSSSPQPLERNENYKYSGNEESKTKHEHSDNDVHSNNNREHVDNFATVKTLLLNSDINYKTNDKPPRISTMTTIADKKYVNQHHNNDVSYFKGRHHQQRSPSTHQHRHNHNFTKQHNSFNYGVKDNESNDGVKFSSFESLRRCLFLRSDCVIIPKQIDRQRSTYSGKTQEFKQVFGSPLLNFINYDQY